MTEVVTGRFTVVNERGMHARAASKLAQLASAYPCEILLSGPEEEAVSGKSVMGVLLLCGAKGSEIQVTAKGDQANEAVEAIGELIASGFGESA